MITFFGLFDTFDYHHLGGMDSFYRRLAEVLLRERHEVTFLHYGSNVEKTESPRAGLTLVYLRNFRDTLEYLDGSDGPVVVNAIHRKDRIAFICYRKSRPTRMFHMVYSVYSESSLKRTLYMLESRILPYNGLGLCVSPRLTLLAQKKKNWAGLFLPPVLDHYFRDRRVGAADDRIRITYLGRIDPGKGVEDVAKIARRVADDGRYEFRGFGYVWSGSPACADSLERVRSAEQVHWDIADRSGWSPGTDRKIADILSDTDILILPYTKLSSTVDIPLLLLEGMAAGCCVLTRAIGDIPAVYGRNSPFLVCDGDFVGRATDIIRKAHALIPEERRRVAERVRSLGVDSSGTYVRLSHLLGLAR